MDKSVIISAGELEQLRDSASYHEKLYRKQETEIDNLKREHQVSVNAGADYVRQLKDEIKRLEGENKEQVEQLATQGRNCEFYANKTVELETRLASADKVILAGLDFANEVKGQIADRAIPGEIDIFTDLAAEYDKGSAARKGEPTTETY